MNDRNLLNIFFSFPPAKICHLIGRPQAKEVGKRLQLKWSEIEEFIPLSIELLKDLARQRLFSDQVSMNPYNDLVIDGTQRVFESSSFERGLFGGFKNREEMHLQIIGPLNQKFFQIKLQGGKGNCGPFEQVVLLVRKWIRGRDQNHYQVRIYHNHPCSEFLVKKKGLWFLYLNPLGQSDMSFGKNLSYYLGMKVKLHAITPQFLTYSCDFISTINT